MREFKRFLERLTSGAARPPEPITLILNDRTISIALRKHASAKRMTLRLSADGEGVVMTIPKRVSRAEALGFAERSRGWLEKQLSRRAPRRAFAHDCVIPLRGVPYRLVETGGVRGLVQCDQSNQCLLVPGAQTHVARRVTDFLKGEAKRDLDAASRRYATLMGTRFKKLSIRDQKSRWGSCSSDGTLSYSWRLILAPPEVLDYVAAHEVAHLREMNHGPRFWRLVLTHCPNARYAKEWLKKHGRDVHAYG